MVHTLSTLLVAACTWQAWSSDVAVANRSYVVDPTPLAPQEQYLKPYLSELLEYRDNPIARRYIFFLDIVDVLPTWLEDLFIPLVIPGSKLTIPLNIQIPLKIPLGPIKIPLPASFTIVNLTLNDLNEFKTLRPLKLDKHSRFSWYGDIVLKQTTITLVTKLKVLGHDINAVVTAYLKEPSIKFSMIFAMNRTRICDVYGELWRSSLHCAVWPIMVQENAGVSGLNITSFELKLDDYNVDIKVDGLGPLDDTMREELDKVAAAMKPGIIANLPGAISANMRSMMNDAALHKLPHFQQGQPCRIDELAPTVDVSQMCVVNNAGLDIQWFNHDCPAHLVSKRTAPYPIDIFNCMNVKDLFPDVKEGQILRLGFEAIAGLHEIGDPAFRYMPDSNSAGFECSGSTLTYNCKFLSVAPVNPKALPVVQHVCVINHGGFAMYFDSKDLRTGSSADRSGTYPINQKNCRDLGSAHGSHEGDEFQVQVQAIGGRSNPTDRNLKYSANNLTATFQCKGSTLSYECHILVEPDADFIEVEQVCVTNHGAFAMFFDAVDLRSKASAGRTSTYPNPQQRCVDLGGARGAIEGDKFEVQVQAIAGASKRADSNVKYKKNGQSAAFDCSGSTTIYRCRLLSPSVFIDDSDSALLVI